jgi:hypothetical protein
MGRVQRCLGLLALLLACAHARAAPCLSQSLTDYLTLGAAGCSIGGITFTDFSLPTVFPPASAIDPTSVTLSPVSSALGTGFSVALGAAAPVTASPGEFFSLRLGFNVAASGLNGAYASLLAPIPMGDASITLLEDFCPGAAFSDPTNLTCAAAPINLVAFAIEGIADNPVSTSFGPFDLLGVVADIGVDAGLSGTAALAGAELRFLTGIAAVPVPSSLALVAIASLALWLITAAASRRRPIA